MSRRIRRTPEEARRLVLETAERRLSEQGLAGLNIVGVAKEAGMSHATLIHHFGNTEGMRAALAEHMTLKLLGDLTDALERDLEGDALFAVLFDALSQGGHAKLLAWFAVEGERQAQPSDATREQVATLIELSAQRLKNYDEKEIRRVVLLAAAAAIGFNIATALPALLGMDEAEVRSFPNWLSRQI